MSAADVVASRHLLGLSQQELADMLGVNRHTIKDWESGRLAGSPGAMVDLGRLIAEHNADTASFAAVIGREQPVILPAGPRPRGWYAAIGARLIATHDDVWLEWAPQ